MMLSASAIVSVLIVVVVPETVKSPEIVTSPDALISVKFASSTYCFVAASVAAVGVPSSVILFEFMSNAEPKPTAVPPGSVILNELLN